MGDRRLTDQATGEGRAIDITSRYPIAGVKHVTQAATVAISQLLSTCILQFTGQTDVLSMPSNRRDKLLQAGAKVPICR